MNDREDELKSRLEQEGFLFELSSKSRSGRVAPITWAYPREARKRELPRQGIKLHITADITSAVPVFHAVHPYLKERGLSFKITASLDDLSRLNGGSYGFSQVGKFITVYPHESDEIGTLARELDHLTSSFAGPEVPSDRRFSPGSSVFYRYGLFHPGHRFLLKPDGEEVEDTRRPGKAVPAWASDPFRTSPAKKKDTNLLGGQYVVLQALRQRAKGGVYQALRIENLGDRDERRCAPKVLPVVIKEARQHGETESEETDAIRRLRWQEQVLARMADVPGFVPVLDRFTEPGRFFLVMPYLPVRSLAQHLQSEEPLQLHLLDLIARVLSLVNALHSRGLAFGDLSPDNILVGESGIYASDLEYAFGSEGPELFPEQGTPGFFPEPIWLDAFSSRWSFFRWRDLYGVAAIFYALSNPDWYRTRQTELTQSHFTTLPCSRVLQEKFMRLLLPCTEEHGRDLLQAIIEERSRYESHAA